MVKGSALRIQKKHELEIELKEWMALSLQGDRVAYEKLLEKVATMVRMYLHRTLGPRQGSVEKVEDLVQEVLVSIHQKKESYRSDHPILPWIYAIARYRLIDTIRAEKRRPQFAEWDDEFESAIDPGATVGVGDLEASEGVDSLLTGLSDRQKEVLTLAKVEELPLAEIAQRMKMSLSAVKVTVFRALASIRKRQEEKQYEDS